MRLLYYSKLNPSKLGNIFFTYPVTDDTSNFFIQSRNFSHNEIFLTK